MKKLIVATILVAVAMPSLAMAQGDKKAEVRLAKLEEIVVTADKAQQTGFPTSIGAPDPDDVACARRDR